MITNRINVMSEDIDASCHKKTYARIVAVQAVYMMHMDRVDATDSDLQQQDILSTIIDHYSRHYIELTDAANEIKIHEEFCYSLFNATCSNLSKIDEIVASFAQDYTKNKIDKVVQSILQVATAEMVFLSTPKKVVASEYTNIAGFFFDKEVNFVNAIIDNIAKSLESSNEELS